MTPSEADREFSRCIHLGEVTREGTTRHIAATPEVCAALARRFGILAIDQVSADLTVRRGSRQSLSVEGTLSAQVTQECVVTLEPVESSVEQAIEERFVPAEKAAGPAVIVEGEDDFEEPIEGDTLDLGEIVAQCLSLALDPYPRKEGAALELQQDGGGATGAESPFAALANLKRTSN